MLLYCRQGNPMQALPPALQAAGPGKVIIVRTDAERRGGDPGQWKRLAVLSVDSVEDGTALIFFSEERERFWNQL